MPMPPALKLSWCPPAPAEGAADILDLPPDDWALEPKLDGIRVVMFEGQPFTRAGSLLTNAKLADELRVMFGNLPPYCYDGEWLPKLGMYVAFDMPFAGGDWDARQKLLRQTLPDSMVMPAFTARFREEYAGLVGLAEGIVMKRRRAPYSRQRRAGCVTRDWLKRRFVWDQTTTEK